MNFLVNDLSLAGQFHDLDAFHGAVDRLMRVRQEIQRMGSSLYCHHSLARRRLHPGRPWKRPSKVCRWQNARMDAVADKTRPILGGCSITQRRHLARSERQRRHGHSGR